jgi:hypothetical protein
MISKEFKEKLIAGRLIPSYKKIAEACKVSKDTVNSVMNGSQANSAASRKVEDYIRATAAESLKKIKAQEKLILKNRATQI